MNPEADIVALPAALTIICTPAISISQHSRHQVDHRFDEMRDKPLKQAILILQAWSSS